ncbi:MAG: hypothetical protein ACHQK9_02460 [Reyranellales bacterium]
MAAPRPYAASSAGPPVGTIILLVLAFVLYAGMMGSLSDAPYSDAMGRALATGFGAIIGTVLWIVLGSLLIVAAVKGSMSTWGKIGCSVLLPLSLVAMWMAGDTYSRGDMSAIWISALTPPLFVLYALRARLPSLRRWIGETVPNIVLGGAILLLTATPLVKSAIPVPRDPAAEARAEAQEKERIEREEQRVLEGQKREEAEFTALGPDSSMSDYFPYLMSNRFSKQALAGIRATKNRQAEAVVLLQSKPLVDLAGLWEYNVQATPELCRTYADALAGTASNVNKTLPNYLGAAIELEWQLPNIKWLTGARCNLDQPLTILEANLRAVADSSRITGFADKLAALHQSK